MSQAKFATKSELIYRALRKKIINGVYKPHQRIIQSEVARAFGTSEIPVREALQILIAEGLLMHVTHVGTMVAGINMEDLEQIYVVRTALEGLAARLAARNILEHELDSLEENNRKMKNLVALEKNDLIIMLNREFHRVMYSASRNEYLQKHIFELWDLSFRIPGVFALIPGIARLSLTEHEEIVKALKNRDAVRAEKLIGDHKENLLRALREHFKDDALNKKALSTDSQQRKEGCKGRKGRGLAGS